MKRFYILLVIMATMAMAANAQTKTEDKKVYIFGVCFAPTDSVVYMTDELILDNAQLTKKKGFLVGRTELSRQLRDYMVSKGLGRLVCSVSFSTNLKKLDKKYVKQANYFRKHGYLIRSVDQTEFRFNTVRFEE